MVVGDGPLWLIFAATRLETHCCDMSGYVCQILCRDLCCGVLWLRCQYLHVMRGACVVLE